MPPRLGKAPGVSPTSCRKSAMKCACRMENKTLEAAATAAGMSERTVRTWQRGPLLSATKEPRTWRTRPDPFVEVGATEIEPLLVADKEALSLAVFADG